jgi:hypothetical protein
MEIRIIISDSGGERKVTLSGMEATDSASQPDARPNQSATAGAINAGGAPAHLAWSGAAPASPGASDTSAATAGADQSAGAAPEH